MNCSAILRLCLLAGLLCCQAYGASNAEATRPSEVGRFIVASPQTVKLYDAPLTSHYFGLYFTRGTSLGYAQPLTEFRVVNEVRIPTVLGLQTFVEVEAVGAARASGPMRGWVSLSTADVRALKSANGKPRAPSSLPGFLSNPWIFTCLYLLAFGGFAFGVFIRNEVFANTRWKSPAHQTLVSIPIGLVVVSTELLGFLRAMSQWDFQLASSVLLFLSMLGAVMVQGILLPELSKRHIESKFRRGRASARQSAAKSRTKRSAEEQPKIAIALNVKRQAGLAHARSKGQKLGRPKVSRDRDKDAKVIRRMRAEGDSYGEIAEALGRTKSDIYRVCMTLGCQPYGENAPKLTCLS